MLMRKIKNSLLGDLYYEIDHESGLKIFVYPKVGYESSYAVFGTNYGSIDTFIKRQGEDAIKIPEGTAHFLEHKLFESEEQDAFERFATTGASANAFTSFDKTCYLFSCSNKFAENLEILLDFVQHPYFTQETVEKEQGIIGQEIKMYQDVPSWQVLFNLFRCLFHNHPVKIDIAGTVESIAEISAELLYDCYNNFYNLDNMVLACAGNTTVEEVLSVVDRIIKKGKPIKVERKLPNEPISVVSNYFEEKLAVAIPLFSFGIKMPIDGLESLKTKIADLIIADCVMGKSSKLYNRLLEKGFINKNLECDFMHGPGYKLFVFTGESREAKKVVEEIKSEILTLQEKGIKKEDYERILKMHYGRAIMDYNDIEGLGNDMVSCYFNGDRLYDELKIYKKLTLGFVNKELRNIDVYNSALSVVSEVEM